MSSHSESALRAIAFYLPQYHPVPENDEWWGEGFTEWRNVTKAHSLFPGHYQPHLPADLGFYDLRLAETREAQADLAREYGIHGFCYYHYWFNGRRILERPFNEVLRSGKPDFPFCLCWANENWTRGWDGGTGHILLGQQHSAEDDVAHIRSLIPAFRDPRYIRIEGRPLFLVYRTELLPNPADTAEIWRREAREAGVGELYLARVEQFVSTVDPRSIGFDAAVEFAPSGVNLGKLKFQDGLSKVLLSLGLVSRAFAQHDVYSYRAVSQVFLNKPEPAFKRFNCVTPMWDNSARRRIAARIITDSTPALYENWLRQVVERTVNKFSGDERIVFLNAWNEWAEGCHLEPDLKWGRAYLEATRRALAPGTPAPKSGGGAPPPPASSLRNRYWRLLGAVREWRELARQLKWPWCGDRR